MQMLVSLSIRKHSGGSDRQLASEKLDFSFSLFPFGYWLKAIYAFPGISFSPFF